VKISTIDSAFERALSAEIAASELLRVRVLAVTLAVLLVADELLFLFGRDLVEQFIQKPLPAWLPAQEFDESVRWVGDIGPDRDREFTLIEMSHSRYAAARARERQQSSFCQMADDISGAAKPTASGMPASAKGASIVSSDGPHC
jgi:hypothetical protein